MSINDIKSKLPNNFLLMLEEVYTQKERDSIYLSFLKGRNTSFRINTLKGNKGDIIKEFKKNRLNPIDIINLPNTFFLKGQFENKIKRLNCYKNGEIYLQSISSLIPPLFIDYNKGVDILDMCSAPGGKCLYAYDLSQGTCNITANEPNDIRRQILNSNIIKQGAKINITPYNGKNIAKILNNKFDYILIDAPCSGEGILRFKKNSPSYLWNEDRIKKLVKLQKRLLRNGLELLKDEGCIIYSTCTLNPYENEFVISEILSKEKVELIPINREIIGFKDGISSYSGVKLSEELKKCIRIVPSEMVEGFFIAIIKKTK
ncbi:MAG: RsmB/NOP family class I SAM-dependent RNA methyltransferase [Clostridium sp.]